MALLDQALTILDAWYVSLDRYQDDLPSKGSIGAALHVLDRLQTAYKLDVTAHVASGEAQILGLSTGTLNRILNKFGETRPLSSIGGRSNRGARGDVAKLLDAMRPLQLEAESDEARNELLSQMQRKIVCDYVPRYHAAKRVKATFDPSAATFKSIESILENARQSGKAGAVAEYLVGAKLALRFPARVIRNKRFSTADMQSGHSGDFEIGTTVFHVTVAPMPELFAKLRQNLERGLRVYLIVPGARVAGAQQNADLLAPDRIAVAALESFIATNIDELANFDGEQVRSGFRRLLETYNKRVGEIEIDKSLLIDLPSNLS